MENSGGDDHHNWSEAVEDLISAGDTAAAIKLLESVITKLDESSSSSSSCESQTDLLQLSSALTDLAELFNSQGFSLKADELLARAFAVKEKALGNSENDRSSKDVKGHNGNLPSNEASEDDWEAIADREPEKIFPSEPLTADDDWEAITDRDPEAILRSECLNAVSRLTIKETKGQIKRRGRGTFTYQRGEIYSDRFSDEISTDDAAGEDGKHNQEENTDKRFSNYGTRHVLVLADFSPSTRSTDLEKHFEDFKEQEFVIRWVNDTCALAVFQTPSIALKAFNSNRCPFTVRVLSEDDLVLNSVPNKDLEPPRRRPQTSVRTARRLIAQGMGMKLPTSTSESRELKRQEEARRNRIVNRQKLRDDAWGDDD